MNIIFSIDFYMPLHIGGMETYVQVLSKELCERGHKVAICTIGSRHLPNYEKKNGVKIYRFEGLFQKMPFVFKDSTLKYPPPIEDWLITARFKEIAEREKPDIIHANDWILYSVFSLKKKYHIPLVVTLHDYAFICPNAVLVRDNETCRKPLTNQCISCGQGSYRLPIMKLLPVYCALRANKSRLKQVDKFIAISSFQKRVYTDYLGLNDEDIVVIPNSVDTEDFSPNAHTEEALRGYWRKFGIENNSNKIVHVSRFSWDKMDAILNVINATPNIVREFPNTQVLLVGQGECFNYIYGLAKSVNQRLNSTAIVLTQAVKAGDMPKVLGLADIVIGVGRVPLEAMACGKPVIIAGSIVGPFGGSYGGIVTPDNVAELEAHNFSGRNSSVRISADKVAMDCIRLLTDRKYRLSLGSFGRKYTEEEHNAEKSVKRVEVVYHDTITG